MQSTTGGHAHIHVVYRLIYVFIVTLIYYLYLCESKNKCRCIYRPLRMILYTFLLNVSKKISSYISRLLPITQALGNLLTLGTDARVCLLKIYIFLRIIFFYSVRGSTLRRKQYLYWSHRFFRDLGVFISVVCIRTQHTIFV